MPSTNSIDRRKFITVTGLGVGAGLLGINASRSHAASGGDKPFAGQTLRVFVYAVAWEKGFNQHFVPRFEAPSG
ncbi:MAG: twin-arginine translocation signal domain-containing protein [Verrucomicrobiota bacterium]